MVVDFHHRELIAFLGLCEGHYPVVEDILRRRSFTYLGDGLDAERTDKLAGERGRSRQGRDGLLLKISSGRVDSVVVVCALPCKKCPVRMP